MYDYHTNQILYQISIKKLATRCQVIPLKDTSLQHLIFHDTFVPKPAGSGKVATK